MDEKTAKNSANVLEECLTYLGQGVTIFDENLNLVFCNPAVLTLLDLPADLMRPGVNLESIFRFNAERGDYGAGDADEQVRTRIDIARQFKPHVFTRERCDGKVILITGSPLPSGGGFITFYQDITQRHTAEQKLQESEQRFKDIAEASSDWIWETGPDYRFTYISERFTEVTGFPVSHFIGKTRWEAQGTTPDHPNWVAHVRKIENRLAFRDFSYLFTGENGIQKWFTICGKPAYSSDGTYLGYRGTGTDSTEKIQAQKEAALFAQVVEQSPVSIIITDEEGVTQYANQRAFEVSEYDASEVIGNTPRIFKSGKTPNVVYEKLWDTIKQGKHWHGVLENKTKSGKLFWENINISPLKDKDGAISNFIGIKEDITRQKETEHALRQYHTKLEKMVEARTAQVKAARKILMAALSAMTDGVAVIDDKRKIIFFNSAFAKASRKTPEQLLKQPTLDQVLNDYAATLDDPVTFKSSKQAQWYLAPKGSTEVQSFNGRWLRLSAFPMDGGHQVLVQSDITAYKENERTLKEGAEALARALTKEKEHSKIQRDFISLVSHEFRTPLAIIDSNAQRISRRIDKLDKDEIVLRMSDVRQMVERMTELMESTISLSRLDAGKIEFAPEVGDLRHILEDAANHTQQVSEIHTIQTDLSSLPRKVIFDPKLMRQVVTNLLSNAVKYSPKGGVVEIKGWQENGSAVFSVRDEGLGIPENEVSKLFQKFFRASTSTGIAGSGIGLHLINSLVKMHGGTVSVQTQENVGSVFTVSLPVPQEQPTEYEAE